jgi:hypothetical protein
MIAVEGKGRDPKFTWEISGIYGAPNEDMRVIERLAARTDYLGDSTKCSIIGGDLNLPLPTGTVTRNALAEDRQL